MNDTHHMILLTQSTQPGKKQTALFSRSYAFAKTVRNSQRINNIKFGRGISLACGREGGANMGPEKFHSLNWAMGTQEFALFYSLYFS